MLSLLCACRSPQERPTEFLSQDTLWLLAHTPEGDGVHASDTEATLVARYGQAEVVRARVDLGEGETEPGTILFPRDSTQNLGVK